MRLDKPVGIWLLMWPCWWSVTLASDNFPLTLLAVFALGAVVMRSAGCIVNDLADRELDRQVARTASRPLASGELSVAQAVALLGVLICIAALVAWYLGTKVFFASACWLIPVALYPFMKRITHWPQLFLGLTFNAGALLGWLAVTGTISPPALCLYLGGICWTLGYDTIYAHQDKRDDALAGIGSTALALGERSKAWVSGFYVLFVAMLALAGALAGAGALYYSLIAVAAIHLGWQVRRVDLDDPGSCLAVFKSNAWAGLPVWLACVSHIW